MCRRAWQSRVCETCIKTSKTGSKETKLFWKWHILMKLTCQRPSLWSAWVIYCHAYGPITFGLPVEVVKDWFNFLGYRHARTSLFFLKMSDISFCHQVQSTEDRRHETVSCNFGSLPMRGVGPSLLGISLTRVWLAMHQTFAERCTKSQIFKCQHPGVEG